MKKMTKIGIIVLVVGIVLVIGGAIGAIGSLTIKTTFTQPHPGEFVSAEILLNSSSNLVVSSPASSGGIVHASDLGLVNSTNLSAYAVPFTTSGAGSNIYESLSGNYYYVAFSSSQPNTKIVATPVGSLATAFGSLALLGIVLVIAGIVLAIVGWRQKPKPQAANQP